MSAFRYELGGKVYEQKPIVLGQLKQLMNLLRGTVLPKEFTAMNLIVLLGDKLPEVISIALCEEGESLKNKDVKALAEELEFLIEPELALRVIEDFFICNPVSSLLERLTGVMDTVTRSMERRS